MSKKISIAIDAMGVENSPVKIFEELSFFIKKNNSEINFILNIFGKEN